MVELPYVALCYASDSRTLLRRGVSEEAITCDLQDFCHDNPPGYEALSYFWSKSSWIHEITLLGNIFKVTENLEAALPHFRRMDRDQML